MMNEITSPDQGRGDMPDDDEGISFSQACQIAARQWWLILIPPILAASIAYASFPNVPPQWESVLIIRIGQLGQVGQPGSVPIESQNDVLNRIQCRSGKMSPIIAAIMAGAPDKEGLCEKASAVASKNVPNGVEVYTRTAKPEESQWISEELLRRLVGDHRELFDIGLRITNQERANKQALIKRYEQELDRLNGVETKRVASLKEEIKRLKNEEIPGLKAKVAIFLNMLAKDNCQTLGECFGGVESERALRRLVDLLRDYESDLRYKQSRFDQMEVHVEADKRALDMKLMDERLSLLKYDEALDKTRTFMTQGSVIAGKEPIYLDKTPRVLFAGMVGLMAGVALALLRNAEFRPFRKRRYG